MTITIKREYSILPQGDRGDDFHHHIRDKGQGKSFHYACLISFIVLVILLILAGVATLTATMFFSDGIKTTFGQYWYTSTSEITGHMGTTASDSFTSSLSSQSNPDLGKNEEGAAPASSSSSSEENPNSADTNLEQNSTTSNSNSSSHEHSSEGSNNSSENELGGGGGSGESDIDDSGNTTDSSSGPFGNMSHTWNSTSFSDLGDMSAEEIKEKFAEAMRDLEKNMENIMGIRRAEFVVPIFMLACFLFSFSLISFCCCFMMRRRENRRKKLFGKLITDLQTGDSKTVLLNHSDLDD